MIPNNPRIEQFRVKKGSYASDHTYGNNGAFRFRLSSGLDAYCLASDQGGWDHVSVQVLPLNVSVKRRCPTWDEMVYVKDMFWSPDECVMQVHPPKVKHVNIHPFVLHLWRPQKEGIPLPPIFMVNDLHR